MSVGQNIKKIRKELGKTQEQMAITLGISRSYLANLEAGRKNVGENTIKKMSEKSGFSTYYLTTGEKTTYDMNDYELEVAVENEVDDLVSMIKNQPKVSINELLEQLSKSKLSSVEEFYLYRTIGFMKNSDNDDIKYITVLLGHLLYHKDILSEKDLPQDTRVEVIEEIDEHLERFNSFIKKYLGYEGD